MDEQLEHALEGNGTETCAPAEPPVPFMGMQASNRAEPGSWRVAAVHEEAAVQVPSPDPTPEETAETGREETEMKTESPTEEADNASDAGLSSTEEGEIPSPYGEGGPPSTAVDEVFPPAGENIVQSRDYYAEWQELAEAHPEVVGKELPEDIYQACMQSDLPPLRVYESMMLQKQNEQIAALQQEIATLRQNAENTARAPVVAAAEGPANEPEDLFMKGFNSY